MTQGRAYTRIALVVFVRRRILTADRSKDFDRVEDGIFKNYTYTEGGEKYLQARWKIIEFKIEII